MLEWVRSTTACSITTTLPVALKFQKMLTAWDANYDEHSAAYVSEPNPPLHNQSARSDNGRSGRGCGSGMGRGWQK
jgi:hypothetical protein